MRRASRLPRGTGTARSTALGLSPWLTKAAMAELNTTAPAQPCPAQALESPTSHTPASREAAGASACWAVAL